MSSPVRNTAWATVPAAASTAMSSVSFVPPVLQPGMVAAVDLHQHALLGQVPAILPVPLGAAAARTALTRMRRTVGRLRLMLSRSRSSSVK